MRGRADACTWLPRVTQCAETTQIAVGRGSSLPSCTNACVKRLDSMAFIGDPWPINSTGVFVEEVCFAMVRNHSEIRERSERRL